ncbi:methyltransferase domain-containing protein [Candidatus Saccharibacteria bacterium]|nr:methyltransferase domain-containing protein [Candidatus Saccharibacteria bacterium]
MILLILGRQPEIGIAELRAVFGNVETILPGVVLVAVDEIPNIDRLGGIRKIGRVIYDNDGNPGKFLLDKFSDLPPGKITLGISHYGKIASATSAKKTAMFLKSHLERSVRVLPNTTAEISDAATLGNKLGSSPNKVELLMAYIGHRLVIAELVGVQNLNAYTLRDRGRPKRDARVGMLPPKLAQIMINLAHGACKNSLSKDDNVLDQTLATRAGLAPNRQTTLLDPFCGTGVILQEAALMGFDVYGTDIESRMIDFTKTNLAWLEKTHQVIFKSKSEVGDATNYIWSQPIDVIATETYLGQPYTTPPPTEKLQQNITTCNTILSKFLINLAPQITPETGLCVAVPCWFLNNKTYHLPLVCQLVALGYEQIFYSDDQKPLIYHRENQIVARELLVLRRKP